MTSYNRGGPRKGRPDTTTAATGYTDHETYMRQLDQRIEPAQELMVILPTVG